MSRPTRRRVLLAGTALVGSLAGCTSDENRGDDATEPTSDSGTGTGSEGTTNDTADAGDATGTSGDLDLREANVVVEFEESGGGRYRFDVTLIHDVHESFALVSQPERSAFW